jgi:hypothetical protein
MTLAKLAHNCLRGLVACLVVFAAACGDDDDSTGNDAGNKPNHMSEAGPPDASDDGATDTTADAMVDASGPEPGSPTFAGVFRDVIVGAGCNAGPLCHGGPSGKLQMDTAKNAYENLVGVKAMGMNLADTTGDDCKDTGLVRVVPKDPDHSLIMQKIDPPGGKVPCGTVMPPVGTITSEQIEQVRAWIENGAKDD